MGASAERTSDGRTGFTTTGDLVSETETPRALGEYGAALEWSNFDKPTKHTRGRALHELKPGVIRVVEGPNNA